MIESSSVIEPISVFARGLLIGLMVAVPVGPVGLLCLRRTLRQGTVVGIITGLGAASADALFGSVAALGISFVLDFIHKYDSTIHILGGLLLIFLAWRAWRDKSAAMNVSAVVNNQALAQGIDNNLEQSIAEEDNRSSPLQDDIKLVPLKGAINAPRIIRAWLSSFALTLSNPATLFAMIAFMATVGSLNHPFDSATLIGGIFTGSLCWWLALCGITMLFRQHFREQHIRLLNRITAVLLSSIALWAIWTGIR